MDHKWPVPQPLFRAAMMPTRPYFHTLTVQVANSHMSAMAGDDDDDDTFRQSPAAQRRVCRQKKHKLEQKKELQADPKCISVRTTVYKRGNLFTRSCGLDSFPLEGRTTVSS